MNESKLSLQFLLAQILIQTGSKFHQFPNMLTYITIYLNVKHKLNTLEVILQQMKIQKKSSHALADLFHLREHSQYDNVAQSSRGAQKELYRLQLQQIARGQC